MDFSDVYGVLGVWRPVVAVALAAVVLMLIAHRIGRVVVLRLVGNTRVLGSVMRRLDRPLMMLMPLAALQIVWQGAPRSLPGLEAVAHVCGLLLIASITWAASAAVRGAGEAVAALYPTDTGDNLHARRVLTQTRVLTRTAAGIITFAGVALMLMTFPKARQVGTSLLASAGVAGVVIGLAARSVFSNLLAGLQIALAQPIRIDDVLIVQGEWGHVEEITSTYVVLRIWDERRLVIPLQWFIENPFQNWTRTSSRIIGTVFLWLDYGVDLEPLRQELTRLAEAAPEWDRRVCVLQVTDTTDRAMQVRVLVSSASAGANWDLRCKLREGLIAFLRRTRPDALPRLRARFEHAATEEERWPQDGRLASEPPSPEVAARGVALDSSR